MGRNGKKILPMGIPTCGNPMENRHTHMWESYGKSSFPHVGILWRYKSIFQCVRL